MAGKLIDRYAYANRANARALERVFKIVTQGKMRTNLFFLFAVTLAAGFWRFERFFPYGEQVAVCASVFTLCAWIAVSFESGFNRRALFVPIVIAYWILLNAFLVYEQNAPGFNPYVYRTAQWVRLFCLYPLTLLSNSLNMSEFYLAVILVLLCVFAVISGFSFRKSLRQSKWYCNFRRRGA